MVYPKARMIPVSTLMPQSMRDAADMLAAREASDRSVIIRRALALLLAQYGIDWTAGQ